MSQPPRFYAHDRVRPIYDDDPFRDYPGTVTEAHQGSETVVVRFVVERIYPIEQLRLED